MGVLSKFGVPTTQGHQTLMPKLVYRFRVTFGNMAGPGNDNKKLVVTRQVISVSRPTITHDEMLLDVYNSRIYMAGKHTWNPIQVMLRDDVDSEVIKILDQQLQNQLHHFDQSAAKSGAQYKFNMDIETLDGRDDVDAGNAGILDHWSLFGCYLTEISYGDSNYATSDQQQITVSIRYDNAQHGTNSEEFLNQGAVRSADNGNIPTIGPNS